MKDKEIYKILERAINNNNVRKVTLDWKILKEGTTYGVTSSCSEYTTIRIVPNIVIEKYSNIEEG